MSIRAGSPHTEPPEEWGLPASPVSPVAGLPLRITLRAHGDRELFRGDLLSDAVFSIVVATDVTLAACLLPDRLHWLIVASPDWSGRLRRFKSFTTSLAWRCGHSGPLWQARSCDSVRQSDRDLRELAERTVSAALRAGLVREPETYRYQFNRCGPRVRCRGPAAGK
jgi:hypothetical protein